MMARTTENEIAALLKWEQVISDIFVRTEKFPKTLRHSLVSRIENTSLDVLDLIVVAKYSSGQAKVESLNRANIALTRLQVLVRLAHSLGALGNSGYEAISRGIVETGSMLGGWRKSVQANPGQAID